MKGLILKDLLMAKKYCRSYVIIVILFLAISFADRMNFFFVAYPCILCGLIPVTLLAYDERSHWLQYSCTLPYSRKQLVSAKYIVGISVQTAVLILSSAAMAVKMKTEGSFEISKFLFNVSLVFIISSLTASVNLPLMFKLGVEKGRVWYYIMLGFVCVLGVLLSGFLNSENYSGIKVTSSVFPAVFLLTALLIYYISWRLAVRFFEKREI